MKHLLIIRAGDASPEAVAILAAAHTIPISVEADKPLPREFVWMPKGEHEISAFSADGTPWEGKIVCDEAGARAVQALLTKLIAEGHRVPLDKNHEDGEATAWVEAFRWDPARGIVVQVEWTSLGEQLLRGKVYRSFSPAFLLSKKTSRVAGFPGGGHAAGGLVNAPAFGTAMPSLIAARLAGTTNHKPASGGTPDNQKAMKELLVKILAALAVSHAADATEEQLVALATKHIDRLPEAGAEGQALKTQLAELQALKTKDATELLALRAKDQARRKADAKAAVDAAVARGAIPPKDEAIQAKWLKMIEDNPDHAELLAKLPDNPALKRVTEPGDVVVIGAKDNLLPILQQLNAKKSGEAVARGMIYARHIAPLFAKSKAFGRELGLLLAENSLGTLASELVLQRSLSLLKLDYPFLFELTTDYSDAGANFGQTIQTRKKGTLVANEFNPATGYGTNNAATTDIPITIDQHFGVPVRFNVNELAATNRDLFGEQAEGMHSALADEIVGALYALITAGNFENATTTTLTGFKRSVMTAIARKLFTRKIGSAGRLALLSPEFYEQIQNDQVLVNLATQQRAELVAEYQVPKIAGIQPYQAVSLPTTGDLAGFACTARALGIATRLPNDYTQALPGVPSNGIVRPVFNPETGITVQQVQFVDHKLAAAESRVALMFGVGVGDGVAGERIVQIEGDEESS